MNKLTEKDLNHEDVVYMLEELDEGDILYLNYMDYEKIR